MHVIQYSSRIYTFVFLCLCAAVLLAPSVVHANDGYWSTTERRFISGDEVRSRINNSLSNSVNRPSGSTISAAPSAPTITKNSSGGLSASTNQILKEADFGRSSPFTATSNYSVASAKTALKSCMRSAACAGRALGAGAIIYEGIQGWKSVYEYIYDEDDGFIKTTDWSNPIGIPSDNLPSGVSTAGTCGITTSPCVLAVPKSETGGNPTRDIYCNAQHPVGYYLGYTLISGSYSCLYYPYDAPQSEFPKKLVSQQELDDSIDNGYNPDATDAPIVLLSGDPDTLTLSNPAPAELPSTTTTNTDSQGKTTTTVKNSVITYNILNNNTSNPSIESTITETSNTYDESANFLGSMTSTTTNQAVQPDPLPPPTAGASVDIEIPPFCTWASIVCDWIGWTQEELGEDDPDLSQLITVFEPDEDGFDVGIGSGSCPAPMLLNLGIIGKTVEVKYDPFCSFLEMIRPFVLAAAYLFAAYLYVGVLRRG